MPKLANLIALESYIQQTNIENDKEREGEKKDTRNAFIFVEFF